MIFLFAPKYIEKYEKNEYFMRETSNFERFFATINFIFFPFLGQKVDILAQCAILHPEIFEAKIGRRTCTTPIVRSVMDRPMSNY